MPFNILYLSAMLLLAPWLAWRALRTGRYRRGLAAKLLGRTGFNPDHRRVVWFHGVSVGEIHLLVTLVKAFRRRHPECRVVVSSTTDTGLAEARAKFADLDVIAWPFDFTWAVANVLEAVRPSLIVLAEAELWPNVLAAAAQRRVPVVVVNARLSPRSFHRYRRVAGLARRFLFQHVAAIGVQSEDYRERFALLGIPDDKLHLTGSIKYDGALAKHVDAAWLAPFRRDALTLVAGSTHAPEEEIVLAAFEQLQQSHPQLRLILVPRHPDRFEEVSRFLERRGVAFVRRSKLNGETELPPVMLLDTVGELAAAWSVADLGYVGGTIDCNRGGQSMIEPAGFGVPTVFGPQVWNFRDAAARLVEAGGAVQIRDKNDLAAVLETLIADHTLRQSMGAAARRLVEQQQGATQRTLDLLRPHLGAARAAAA